MAVEATIHVILPAIVGLAIGILEGYFVYEDEGQGGLNGFFGKVWHGIIFAIVGVLISANVPWIVSLGIIPGFIEGLLFITEAGLSWTLSAILAIVMFVKIDMAHRIKGVGGGGFVEKPWHKLVVSLLIGFGGFIVIPMYNIEFIANLAIPFI